MARPAGRGLVRALLVIPLLLLAGCAGSAPPEAPPSTPAAPTEAPPEDPRIQAASSPPNEEVPKEAGLAGEAHAHDLWDGQTRRLLLDAPAATRLRTDGVARAFVRSDPGLTVLEGTGHVEVTIRDPARRACSRLIVASLPHCTPDAPDPAPSGSLELLFRHASTTDWIPAGPIGWGTPVAIPIEDPTWVDMPHSGLSLWEFQLASSSAQDETLVFRVKAELVRGPGAIPLWPGHPRFYDEGNHVREIFAGSATTRDGPTILLEPLEDANAVAAEKLVSFGTRTLVVDVNITRVESPPGTGAGHWYLVWSNATGGWRGTDFGDSDHPGSATSHRFVIEVDETGMDSPYSERSRWRFALLGSFRAGHPDDDDLAVILNRAVYEVDYEMRVVASDLAPEAFGGLSGPDPTETR